MPGKFDLLPGNVKRLDRDSIVAGHVYGQSAPTAADIDHGLARPQPQFAADVIQLGQLRFGQGHVVPGEICTTVDHLRIEPELIKVVADVVMPMYVFPRAGYGIRMPGVQEPRPYFFQRMRGCAGVEPRSVEDFQEIAQVAIHLEAALAVCLAELKFGIEYQAPQSGPVADKYPGGGWLVGRCDFFAIPQEPGAPADRPGLLSMPRQSQRSKAELEDLGNAEPLGEDKRSWSSSPTIAEIPLCSVETSCP